jgi:hypothetical protein
MYPASTGRLRARPNGDGGIEDLSGDGLHLVLAPDPEAGLFAPGHCSYARDSGLGECLVAHARFGDGASPRRICLVPLRWTEDDRPYCPPPSMPGS